MRSDGLPLALLAVLTLSSGCSDDGGGAPFELDSRRYDPADFTQWALPDGLREVSGLALGAQERLFAHGDEEATIFELDLAGGQVRKRFHVGDPARKGDFEGLAWHEGYFYLVTSDGTLLRFREGSDEEHVEFELTHTGLGRQCEIEGLHAPADGGLLLLACKTPRQDDLQGRLAVLAWSLPDARPQPADNVMVEQLPADFAPSGLTRCPDSGNLLLVAARQRALIEVSGDGELVRALRLPGGGRHPQMEGVELTSTGNLIIADEGGSGRGRLGVYAAQ